MFVIFVPCQFVFVVLELIDLNQSDLPVNLKHMNAIHAWSVCTSMVHI